MLNFTEQTVKDVFLDYYYKIDDIHIKYFIESILACDGLCNRFTSNFQSVTEDILSCQSSSHIYIPCYTAELRNILKNKKIVSNYKIAAFSFNSAKKYLVDYPVLIVLDSSKVKKNALFESDGILIFNNCLNIEEAIVRISVNDRENSAVFKDVCTIVDEESIQTDINFISDVPGISYRSAQSKLKKFVVNIPSLGIEKEIIKQTDEISALEEALNRQWHKTGNPHRDSKYTVDYWLNSPIVNGDPAVKNNIVRQAQKSDLNKIELSDSERKIFNFLVSLNNKYNLGLTFRVSGGWVRDKLLGKESDDIDIAIDKMTGSEFGKYLEKELGKSGNIIQARPDQSKHLETLTIPIFGQSVDFVNLRSESYGDTRIPNMQVGTPEQDAFRRDLTINSLFYNINSGEIEDFTGKGLEDLKSMTLRTPLDPVKTFADDPLRVFRTLRFYAKYNNAKLAPEIIDAMKDPSVLSALNPKNLSENGNRKISEERILKEWQKLFKGRFSDKALRVLHQTGIWDLVFVGGAASSDKDLSKFHPFTMDQNNPWHIDSVLEHTLKVVQKYDEILAADGADDEDRARAKAAAFMHDLGKLDPSIIGEKELNGIIKNTYHGHEDSSAIAAEAILRGIKSSNEDIEYIRHIVQNHMLPHNKKITDKQINKMIRKLGKHLTRRIIQHALADATSKPGGDEAHYNNLLNMVNNAQIPAQVKDIKPVIPGGEIMQMFPTLNAKTGFIKEIQDILQDIKDGNPALAKEDALLEIEKIKPYIINKYQNIVKGPMKDTPEKKAFNLKSANNKSTVEMICGKVMKHRFGVGKNEQSVIFILSDNGINYALRRSQVENSLEDNELKSLVGQRICGKGMVHDSLFIISEYSIVNLDKDQNVVEMKRNVPEDVISFNKGDKVRHRKRGLAFNQIDGEVVKIDNGLLFVKWEDIDELEIFNLNDPISLFGVLQKV